MTLIVRLTLQAFSFFVRLLFTGNVAFCYLNNAYFNQFEAPILPNKARELDTENFITLLYVWGKIFRTHLKIHLKESK